MTLGRTERAEPVVEGDDDDAVGGHDVTVHHGAHAVLVGPAVHKHQHGGQGATPVVLQHTNIVIVID